MGEKMEKNRWWKIKKRRMKEEKKHVFAFFIPMISSLPSEGR